MTNNAAWGKGSHTVNYDNYIVRDNSVNCPLIFNFPQSVPGFLIYPAAGNLYETKSASSINNWCATIGAGVAKEPNVATIKFYVRTA